jgi:hypothetical protein
MSHSTSLRRHALPPEQEDAEPLHIPVASAAPWLALVAEKVKAIRYGVVQVVVHDGKVVQIERTERTRFEVPPALQGR